MSGESNALSGEQPCQSLFTKCWTWRLQGLPRTLFWAGGQQDWKLQGSEDGQPVDDQHFVSAQSEESIPQILSLFSVIYVSRADCQASACSPEKIFRMTTVPRFLMVLIVSWSCEASSSLMNSMVGIMADLWTLMISASFVSSAVARFSSFGCFARRIRLRCSSSIQRTISILEFSIRISELFQQCKSADNRESLLLTQVELHLAAQCAAADNSLTSPQKSYCKRHQDEVYECVTKMLWSFK